MNLTRKAGLQSTDAVERETITPGIGVSTPNSTERMMTLTGLLCIYFVSLYQFDNNLLHIVAERDYHRHPHANPNPNPNPSSNPNPNPNPNPRPNRTLNLTLS